MSVPIEPIAEAGTGHRRDQQVQLFVGVAEHQLPQVHAVVRHVLVRAALEVVERQQTLVEPLLVRVFGCQLVLDLLVVDDAAGLGVHQEHAARLQSQFLHHVGVVDVEHAHLRGHHDQTVPVTQMRLGRRPLRSRTRRRRRRR